MLKKAQVLLLPEKVGVLLCFHVIKNIHPWRVIPWSCSSLPKSAVIRKCGRRSMGGDFWVHFLKTCAQACCIPEGQPLVQGGVEAVEKTFADLLRDSPYDGHRWHSLRRGGATAAFHRSPNVPYFLWWRRWWRLATTLEYALG